MKKLILILLINSILFSCEVFDSNNDKTQEKELSELIAHHDYILSLVKSTTCTSNSQCDYIAIGSKACGGPKSYLAYPSSMDTKLLFEQVAIYNLKEQQYNQKWGIVSDCMFVSPPIRVDCINNKCVAVYNN
ncbi:MAG: hypothetical protein Q8S44_05710 [Flavobacteriaceae bacterium]|nr:hypothetical protein [Flavobacteriaceae bacterium]